MMGVSLERVQFKFATIIGELCNEPFILSQFAVWLDLRLAEYKLQGAISLECSNERPDPDWLKGVKNVDVNSVHAAGAPPGGGTREISEHNPHRSKTKALSKSQTISSSDYGHAVNMPEFGMQERIRPKNASLSRSVSNSPHDQHHSAAQSIPEIVLPESLDSHDSQLSPGVIVKLEPEADDIPVFPVTLHSHAADQNSLMSSVRRKRRVSATDIVSTSQTSLNDEVLLTSEEDYSSSQHKASRFTDPLSHSTPFPSRSDDSIAFQNLMSARESFSNPGALMGDLEGNEVALFKGNNSASSDPLDLEQPKERGDLGLQDLVGEAMEGCEGEIPRISQPYTLRQAKNVDVDVPVRSNSQDCMNSTVKNATSAGWSFTRWLRSSSYRDIRSIEEIPPTEMDPYLVEYFSTIKKQSGKDYGSNSLQAMRANLERCLKDRGYKWSIVRSKLFLRSQVAFQTRKLTLAAQEKKAKLKK